MKHKIYGLLNIKNFLDVYKRQEPGPEVKPSQNPEEPPGQTGGETDQTRRGISPWKAAAVILCCLLIGAGLIYLGLKLMRKRPDVPTDQK